MKTTIRQLNWSIDFIFEPESIEESKLLIDLAVNTKREVPTISFSYSAMKWFLYINRKKSKYIKNWVSNYWKFY